MAEPIIGIVSKNFKIPNFYDWQQQVIYDAVRYAVNKNGGIVIGVLPQKTNQIFNLTDSKDEMFLPKDEIKKLKRVVSMCDGIILQGGLTAHNYEEFIAKFCYDNNIPCLGICSGFNNIVRALGGKTTEIKEQTVHDRPDLTYAHLCKVIDKDSLFYKIVKKDSFKVNSIHTYIADIVSEKLGVVAYSDDGQVEVVEAKNKKFFIATKYHPELLIDVDEHQNNLFKYFINACKNNKK